MKIEIDSELIDQVIGALKPFIDRNGNEDAYRAYIAVYDCCIACERRGVPGYEIKLVDSPL